MSTTYDNIVSPEFDPHSGTFQTSLNTDGSCSATTELILIVSSLTGDEPTQMLPLNNAVDPDALERHVSERDRDAELSFDFHGYHIIIRGDGQVTFTPIDEQEVPLNGS
ncbi:HalOD1 output domain-containing protein [Halosimplex amylolyticum]|uniref:HalOD1 output domain-containing protein n=1 Tax=Halosimplex amylolyticum TaxID=3396616 RepID=UPI003F57E4CA